MLRTAEMRTFLPKNRNQAQRKPKHYRQRRKVMFKPEDPKGAVLHRKAARRRTPSLAVLDRAFLVFHIPHQLKSTTQVSTLLAHHQVQKL